MKHPARADALKEIYSRIGEVSVLHNLLENVIDELCRSLFPKYLRFWYDEQSTQHFFNQKLETAKKLISHHVFLGGSARQVFPDLFLKIKVLNSQRNDLIHANMELEIDAASDGEDIEFLASFKKKKRTLDTSKESLDELLDSYRRVIDELDSVVEDVKESLYEIMGYGPDDE